MKMLHHKFVEFIPSQIEAGVLYISIEYCTAIHKCVCGCGHEVVTPLSPTDWKLIFDGKTVSLHPSIGNWNFKCKSHYWIRNNKIEFSGRWTEKEIREGRERDTNKKNKLFSGQEKDIAKLKNPKRTFWQKLYSLF